MTGGKKGSVPDLLSQAVEPGDNGDPVIFRGKGKVVLLDVSIHYGPAGSQVRSGFGEHGIEGLSGEGYLDRLAVIETRIVLLQAVYGYKIFAAFDLFE